MADLNSKTTFDLAEIELLAEINDWKMNTCGIPPENKTQLWIKESQCRRSQLPTKLVFLNQIIGILKRGMTRLCQSFFLQKILHPVLFAPQFGLWVNLEWGSPCCLHLSSTRVLENLEREASNPSLEAEERWGISAVPPDLPHKQCLDSELVFEWGKWENKNFHRKTGVRGLIFQDWQALGVDGIRCLLSTFGILSCYNPKCWVKNTNLCSLHENLCFFQNPGIFSPLGWGEMASGYTKASSGWILGIISSLEGTEVESQILEMFRNERMWHLVMMI